VLLGTALISALGAPALHAQASADPPLREAVLEIVVNGQTPGEMFVVLRAGADGLWLDASDFARLRLRVPAVQPYLYQQRPYLPLNAMAGVSVTIDEEHQSAVVTLPVADFVATRVSIAARGLPQVTTASPGAFLNYQISAERIAGVSTGGVLTELGVFGPAGVATSTALARALGGERAALRLDTAFVHDFPERLQRLTVGDAISDGGSWGSAVHFGGVGWGKNFTLRPDLVTTPLMSATGNAVVPSTVDVFVNNQKVSSQSLPPGPFVIDQLPAVTGAGEVSVVVRDALGREQLLTEPFYSGLQQLAAGLSQFQFDLGKLRNDYAVASNHYGATLADGTYRHGLTNLLTLEGHGEALEHGAHSIGVSAAVSLGSLALINGTLAAGGDAQGSGSLLAAGLERRGERLSFVLGRTYESAGYRQVASSLSPALQFHTRDVAQLGAPVPHVGSVSVAYARQSNYSAAPLQTWSADYSRNAGRSGIVTLTATRTQQAGVASSSVFLTFTLTLDRRRALLLSANGGAGPGSPDQELDATYVQSPPVGPGQGYRLGVSTHGNYDADWRNQGQAGELELEAARNQGVAGTSAYWSGAFTLLGGDVHAVRQVNDSFALVDVGGLPNIPVYIDNQLITHTDAGGRALLHQLLPYQSNRIGIEPVDLPLDTAIGARTLVIAPPYRSGVVVRFPVEHVAGATFHLVLPDGQPVPLGAQVRFKGKDFPVTYEGMTYVTGFDHGLAGEAHWAAMRCSFRLGPPPADDPLPDMGTVACQPLPAAAP